MFWEIYFKNISVIIYGTCYLLLIILMDWFYGFIDKEIDITGI